MFEGTHQHRPSQVASIANEIHTMGSLPISMQVVMLPRDILVPTFFYSTNYGIKLYDVLVVASPVLNRRDSKDVSIMAGHYFEGKSREPLLSQTAVIITRGTVAPFQVNHIDGTTATWKFLVGVLLHDGFKVY
jgi:hypothetical protein